MQTSGLVGPCLTCSLPLPLRRPEAGEEGLEWLCADCGASYRGVLLKSWPDEFQGHVRPGPSQAEQSDPAELAGWSDSGRPEPISIAIPDHRGVRCELETPLSREFDAEIQGGLDLQVQLQSEPYAARIRRHGIDLYEKEVVSRLAQLFCRSSERLGELFASLKTGGAAGVQVVEKISKDGLFRVAEDMDLFVYLGITPSSGGYPSRHSLRVGMLAMSIGVTLGWDEQALLDLGIGCLLHDVGMLSVDQATYESNRILSPSDFHEIAEHPVLAVQSLQRHLHRIPASARMVAYQMHERCDGTGYPRGYKGGQIHELAKVAAVADVFVALVTPRPHRPGMVPYYAMKKVLHDTKVGLYDAHIVRALLETVSLFPIGSYIALNDGRVGNVIRAAGTDYSRPIIEVWRRGDPLSSRSVIDLSRRSDVKIASTLAYLS